MSSVPPARSTRHGAVVRMEALELGVRGFGMKEKAYSLKPYAVSEKASSAYTNSDVRAAVGTLFRIAAENLLHKPMNAVRPFGIREEHVRTFPCDHAHAVLAAEIDGLRADRSRPAAPMHPD